VLATLGIGLAAEPDRETAARGSVMYRVYCSNCHGRAGKGDGKLATSLVTAPADLTQLARNNGGVFDADQVYAAIDGREEVAAHGERDMPVWGLSFRHPEAEDDQEPAIRARLEDLVAFLATIQAPAEKKQD
jgi:mono/diheme cytochrome c family protein